MNTIIFATTNPGKVASLQKYCDLAGLQVKVEAKPLTLVEIQADTALEVARAKAAEAYRQLGQPLVVDDSELRITALNGFPGPYQKAMTEKLGPEGFVRLLQGYDDRSAYFISNLVYVDAEGIHHEFSDDPYWGTIAEAVDTIERENAWGPLWKIFIPKGLSVTTSQLSVEEKHAYDNDRDDVDAYKKFAAWYKERHG
jgi:non-canonical purine NTP pyrophosphatase (RdgB/HAM1 family)